MSRSRKSLGKGKKKVKRGGCGGAQQGLMYGGEFVASDATRTYQGSDLTTGGALSPASYGNEAQPLDTNAPPPKTGMMGGRYRSRRFRKSRSAKSMKVFPNNIFRNMF